MTDSPRLRVSSGTAFEAAVGYSRAIRVRDSVFVSGTTAMKDGKFVGYGDAAAQTRQILKNIGWALSQAGATPSDVVRCRIYLTDINQWQAVGAELVKVFGDVRPASTLVEVNALIDPAMMVEIEVDAIVDSDF
ncbi:MAG: RidA family protein [Chloroflexota bacterium]|nr:RidA family protein [Chloroflexota bacterium]